MQGTRRRLRQGAVAIVPPLALASLWVPWRQQYPDIDLALGLVLLMTAIGLVTGSPRSALVAAASGAWWFDFLDTRPYGQAAIASAPDMVTFVALAVVGGSSGVVAAMWASRRRGDRSDYEDLHRLRNTAGVLATAEELVDVIEAVSAELSVVLELEACWFDAEDGGSDPQIGRDGDICPARPVGGMWRLSLPVWAQGRVVGHFRLVGRQPLPGLDRRRLAVALADQAGAALAAYSPLVPPPPGAGDPGPRLRVVRPPTTPPPTGGDRLGAWKSFPTGSRPQQTSTLMPSRSRSATG